MKMTFILFASILFCSLESLAQTKLIAHKSHSGSPGTFSLSGTGNFGLPSDYKEKLKKTRKTDSTSVSLDTLIRTGVDTIQKATAPLSNKSSKKKPANRAKG